jgi:hypothetical protein
MAREPKGYLDSSGKRIKRVKPRSTWTGIVLYKGRKDTWVINYPDSDEQYGGVSTIKLLNLIYNLGHGKNLDKSRELANLIRHDN